MVFSLWLGTSPVCAPYAYSYSNKVQVLASVLWQEKPIKYGSLKGRHKIIILER